MSPALRGTSLPGRRVLDCDRIFHLHSFCFALRCAVPYCSTFTDRMETNFT